MVDQFNITPFNPEYKETIISLLQSEGLPVEDLPLGLPNFLMAKYNGFIVGAIGMETYGHEGLLRSLVVKRAYRKMSIAARMIEELERLAKTLEIKSIFLLTETAQDYFLKKGYEFLPREQAPGPIRQSSEFTHACPASATLMQKKI